MGGAGRGLGCTKAEAHDPRAPDKGDSKFLILVTLTSKSARGRGTWTGVLFPLTCRVVSMLVRRLTREINYRRF